jgi:O-antigen/teichoic acid export membrane protein
VPAREPGEAVPAAARFRVPTVWLVAGGGWVGRGLQVAAQLLAIRILMQDLGTAGYGVFAVAASLTGWLLLSDFSLGISIQNFISERRATGGEAEDIVFTGALLSLLPAALVALLAVVAGPWLSARLLGGFAFLSADDRTAVFRAVALPGVGTALGGVVYRIWFAQHRGYLSNLLPAAGTAAGTAAIWVMARTGSGGSIAASTFAYYLPLALFPMAALAVATLRAGRRHRFDRALVRPLLARAGRFWISGLLAAAVLQVDFIIMARVLPVHEIVVYSVASKLFALILFVYAALLLALWPVCAEAIARADWGAVDRTVRRYMLFGAGFTLVAGAGVLLLNGLVVRLLAPGLGTALPLAVIGLFTLYTLVRVWTDTFSTVLQSMNDLTVLWAVAPAQSLCSIALQWLGARWFGLPGVIGGLIGCFLLTAAWALPLRLYQHRRR